MGAPRAALNATTQSVGFTAKLVTITAISADGLTAVTVDRQNTQTQVPMLVQRAKALLPAVGETWLLAQDLGMWTFAAFVASSAASYPAPAAPAPSAPAPTTTPAIPATPPWTQATLQDGWANVAGQSALGYRKTLEGDVWLFGNVSSAAISGTRVTTLPSGYYNPNAPADYPVGAHGVPPSGGFIRVDASGGVTAFGATTTDGPWLIDLVIPMSKMF